MSRAVGLFGLRPTPLGHKWQMPLASYMDIKVLPPIPAGAFGHTNKVQGEWGMLCNDSLGCCVVSGAEHETMLWTAEGTAGTRLSQAVFGDDCTVQNYELLGNYTPGDPDTDNGCDMLHAAELRIRKGIVDANGNTHKLGVALELECGPGYLNMDQFWYANYYFDGVGLGISVTPSMQQDFADGVPWDAADYNPAQVVGGHYVPGVAREEVTLHGTTSLETDVVSWGAIQQITVPGLQVITNTVLVYGTQEKLRAGKDLEGLSWSDIRSDIHKLNHIGALRGIHRL